MRERAGGSVKPVWLTACALATLALACGDSGSSTGAGGGSTTTGSGGTGGECTPPMTGGGSPGTCAQPCDPGNDIGVGRYCTPGGGECGDFPLAVACLADFGQDEWFCTRIGCDATTNCGEGAGCLIEGAGSACVPCECDSAGIGCGGGTGGGGGGVGGSGGAGVGGSGGN